MLKHSFATRVDNAGEAPYYQCTNCKGEFGGTYTPEQLGQLGSAFGNCSGEDSYDLETYADLKVEKMFAAL